MDPRGVFGEFFYEPGAGDGAAAFAGAGVANVRDIAFDHFLVFVVHGHGPHFFADGFGAFEKVIEVFARSTEGADVDAREGDLDGAGERGRVNQVRAAELAGVEHAVGQDHAAFRVGVDYFDGLAGHSDLHVTGFLGAAAGHVLRGGNYREYRDRRLQIGDGAHGAEHGGAAAHVVLHFFHVVGGLDGNTAGIEGDGFADEAENRGVRAGIFRGVADDDDAGRLDAALSDTYERAHFQLGDFALVENFDAEADFLSHGFGARGEHARREAVGRLVDQVARKILRFGDDAATVKRGRKIRARRRIETGEQHGLDFAIVLLLGVVLV